MTDTTTDTFFNGRIQVRQPRTGYRFSIDAVLLAHLAEPRPKDRVLELGTGCGIVSLILAHRMPGVRVTAVELQAELAELARENVRRNGLEARIAVVEADLRTLWPKGAGGPFDLVLSNPPYRRWRSGRINPDPQKAVARHEIESRLSDVIAAARRLLTRSGRFALIYPAERAAELLTEMCAARIEPKQMRAIHSRLDAEAKLVMVEGASGAGPALKIGPPLAVYGDDGKYTPQVAAMFQG